MRVVEGASGSVGTIRSASASDGGILIWDNLVRGQPLADYGRSTKMQDGCQSLERRQSLWKNCEMFFQSLHNDPFATPCTSAAWLALRGASAGGFVFSTRGLTTWIRASLLPPAGTV